MRPVFFLISFLVLATAASAQYDANALAVLNAMSTKYKKINAYQATFSQNVKNEIAEVNESLNGKIFVKGDKYKLEVAGQEIFNNGEEVWSFNKELGEVTVTVYDPAEQEINLGNIYDLYKEGYKYNLVTTSAAGERFVELDPESRDKSYYKIKMTIDKNDELKNFTVLERSGNIYFYEIKGFEPKPNLTDATFNFDMAKHPNVELIDFR